MKRVLMITAVLTFVYGSLFASPKQVAHVSFHKVAAKSPEPGMLFLYPERIKLKDGGFFNAERGMMFVPVNRSKPNSDVISVESALRANRPHLAGASTPPAPSALLFRWRLSRYRQPERRRAKAC